MCPNKDKQSVALGLVFRVLLHEASCVVTSEVTGTMLRQSRGGVCKLGGIDRYFLRLWAVISGVKKNSDLRLGLKVRDISAALLRSRSLVTTC